MSSQAHFFLILETVCEFTPCLSLCLYLCVSGCDWSPGLGCQNKIHLRPELMKTRCFVEIHGFCERLYVAGSHKSDLIR